MSLTEGWKHLSGEIQNSCKVLGEKAIYPGLGDKEHELLVRANELLKMVKEVEAITNRLSSLEEKWLEVKQ